MTGSPLLGTYLHADWEARWAQARADEARLLRVYQLALAAFALATAAFALLALRSSAWPLASDLLFGVLFIAAPLAAAAAGLRPGPLRGGGEEPRAGRRLSPAMLAAASLLGALAWLTAPGPFHAAGMPSLPPVLALAIPVLAAAMLRVTERRSPGALLRLGLLPRRPTREVFVGAAFGAALGFHFWIAARALGGIPGAMPAGTALWLLAVATGYRSLGEEVALRGLVYPGLLQAGHPRVPAAIRTVILGSALYLPLAAAAAAPVSLLVVLYGVLFGATATVLRHATGNTVVTLAASVVFQMFLGGALLG